MYRTLIYLLYWSLQVLALPAFLLYLGTRILRNPAYWRHLGERFGFLPPHTPPTAGMRVWFHAVSVGEILTLIPLVSLLRRLHPLAQIYVSTTTLAGRASADSKLAGLADAVFYAPVDYRFAVRRVLRALRPHLVVILETEIWPNLFRDARLSGAQLLVLNGRISDRAWPRYQRWRWFFRPVLSYADAVLAQTEVSCARYNELGANALLGGNLKFDFDPDTVLVDAGLGAWLDSLGASHTWVAASTMPPATEADPDEDDAVLSAFGQLRQDWPRLLLVLAPRRPERFASAAKKVKDAGFPMVRRSEWTAQADLPLPGVLLLDTIGELAGLFSRADLVFMGGSLVHRGGHNPIEPAAFGVPVIAGPHMENFPEIAAEFTEAGAMPRLSSAAELAPAVHRWLGAGEERRRLGALSRQIADRRRGATRRAVDRMRQLLPQALPRPLPSWARRLTLGVLSQGWHAGLRLDRWRWSFWYEFLPAPVVSVGNLAMGGTGKTPFVIWLAGELHRLGRRPVVLTRGYGRLSSESMVLLPGERASVEQTGEEAQLILRSGHAAVGIGSDRFAQGVHLAQRYKPGIVLLDDGFQHWRVRRQVDLVLIDVMDPFRGGVFPQGCLREPFSALERAHAVVLTRTERGTAYTALEQEIRRHHPGLPVFHARAVPQKPVLPAGESYGAFCGLGQPEAFRETLRQLGLKPAFFVEFPDHHRYTAADLTPLAGKARFLLTTEKDRLNVPDELAASLRLLPIALTMEVDEAEALLALVISSGA